MAPEAAARRRLACGSRSIDLATPRIMAVVNVTPDSFSDGGRHFRRSSAELRERGEAFVAEGADFLDIGGESTRPGADPVSEGEELDRVLPALEALAGLPAVLSIDTRKPAVAKAAIAAGAELVNDVGGARDPAMIEVLAEARAGLCLMHMAGEPRTMQRAPRYDDVVKEVHDFLAERVAACAAAGIDGSRLCVDPGFGFGKSTAHNLALFSGLEGVRVAGLPLLVGLSRKRLIGELTGRPVDERAAGSAAAALLAVQGGADIVRVHDVAVTADALKVLAALAPPERAVSIERG